MSSLLLLGESPRPWHEPLQAPRWAQINASRTWTCRVITRDLVKYRNEISRAGWAGGSAFGGHSQVMSRNSGSRIYPTGWCSFHFSFLPPPTSCALFFLLTITLFQLFSVPLFLSLAFSPPISPSLHLCLFKNIYFIWLGQVFSCGIWAPWSGIKPRSPALGATGPPGKFHSISWSPFLTPFSSLPFLFLFFPLPYAAPLLPTIRCPRK